MPELDCPHGAAEQRQRRRALESAGSETQYRLAVDRSGEGLCS